MNVRTASDLIDRAYAAGQIDLTTANRAQNAIRSRDYYGSRMTGEDRRRIVNVRFGIVDVVTPVAALLARASASVEA